MFRISRDNPAYFLTSVTHNRLPIFRTDTLRQVVCAALNEARTSGGFLIFAYVIMLDHIHLITDSAREIRQTLRFVNGVSAKRIIDHLKQNGYESSLAKLRIQDRGRGHKHSVFEHHPNALRITGEDAFMQKVGYIHLNPMKVGLVEHPDEYQFSSARQWHRRDLDDEPLVTDHLKIKGERRRSRRFFLGDAGKAELFRK